ncbi:MAG: hypothetical protein ISR76_09050 [Planctomycetes bacterium]|nr:hypothetical protein [Planctomycetota bacterium]MBL7009132.1 hypothetical protein [Planctomycetota bacterium]
MVAATLADAIPADLRRRLDDELRRQAFDLLHQEAVDHGRLPRAPRAWFEGPLGALVRTLLFAGAGAVIGMLGVAVVLFVLTTFRVLPG